MKYFISFALVAAAPFAAAQAPVYGQCGGQNWQGATTCVAGSVCTYSNAYYSQCLPGTATTAPSSTSTSSSATSSSTAHTIPFLGGVNTAGYDFSVATDGSFNGTGVDPPVSQYSHFAQEGVNLFRIPFAWQLMSPTLGGTISSTFFARYDATVQAALSSSSGTYVIIDLHNYARWNGAIISQGGPTDAQFASLWSQLAAKYASQPRIIFGIMNEPHDIPSLSTWAQSVQAAVTAIRAAGATTQYLLLPGSSYSSAATLPTEAGPYLLNVTDPVGGTSKLIFDVHKYLDSDNSGTHSECVTNNVDVLTTLVTWLKSNGNRQALLSETGGGNVASCETDLAQELAYLKSNSDNLVGFSIWSAGAFDSTYILSVVPNADGSDQPLWTTAVKPYLP
ncbi:glycoside hydrolase family 5 protein [Auriscalpium vulgare]|uniref:Glycoside hydrolase family 5 protein n=1 Tax=Auriscalpium vulgare TaxID=40419 RepID=A0ACB8RXR7_9AGAM|nr:glycoside hydrolase family 5 protein [Auriscalpium vulgare]